MKALDAGNRMSGIYIDIQKLLEWSCGKMYGRARQDNFRISCEEPPKP